MKPIKLTLIGILGCLLLGTAQARPNAPLEERIVDNCEAFNLSAHCIPPPRPAPPRNNFIKDEVVLMYAPKDQAAVAEVTRKYQLTPKSREVLSSIETGVVVANTHGKNPLSLVENIKKEEKKVAPATNNVFQTAALSSKALYSLRETGVNQVHKTTLGAGTLICMVDTPVDIFHPTLSKALIETYDLVDFDANDLETQFHGTTVAGILVSQNQYIGIAPKAKLLAVGAFSATKDQPHFLKGTSANVAKAIDRCIRQNVDVINLSFTGGEDSLVQKVIEKAIAKGIKVVSAGGNNGRWGSTIYPALIPGVITATAVDKNKLLYRMANKGRFIDYAAPGVDVLTIAPGGKYNLSSGTSLSTAHLSGVIALLLSNHKRSAIDDALTQTAMDLGKPGYDQEYGHGLINAPRALSKIK